MIANAGIPTKAGGLDDKIEDWNRVRAVDFDGAYYCARAAGLVFRKQGCKFIPSFEIKYMLSENDQMEIASSLPRCQVTLQMFHKEQLPSSIQCNQGLHTAQRLGMFSDGIQC